MGYRTSNRRLLPNRKFRTKEEPSMSLSILNNIRSIAAQNQLSVTNSNLQHCSACHQVHASTAVRTMPPVWPFRRIARKRQRSYVVFAQREQRNWRSAGCRLGLGAGQQPSQPCSCARDRRESKYNRGGSLSRSRILTFNASGLVLHDRTQLISCIGSQHGRNIVARHAQIHLRQEF